MLSFPSVKRLGLGLGQGLGLGLGPGLGLVPGLGPGPGLGPEIGLGLGLGLGKSQDWELADTKYIFCRYLLGTYARASKSLSYKSG